VTTFGPAIYDVKQCQSAPNRCFAQRHCRWPFDSRQYEPSASASTIRSGTALYVWIIAPGAPVLRTDGSVATYLGMSAATLRLRDQGMATGVDRSLHRADVLWSRRDASSTRRRVSHHAMDQSDDTQGCDVQKHSALGHGEADRTAHVVGKSSRAPAAS